MTLSGVGSLQPGIHAERGGGAFAGRVVAPFAETETAGSTRRLQKHLGALLEPRFIGRCCRLQLPTRFHGSSARRSTRMASSADR